MSSTISQEIRQLASQSFADQAFLKNFDKIVKSCFMNMIDENNNLKLINGVLASAGSDNERASITQGFNVTILLVSQIIKLNLLEIEITILLKELGLTQEFVDNFMPKYNQFYEFVNEPENQSAYQNFNSSIDKSQFMDVEVNQELIISTQYLNALNKDQYVINLKHLGEKENLETVQFKCSHEMLTELVYQLNNAIVAIDSASDLQHVKF